MNYEKAALKAVRYFKKSVREDPKSIKHTPLHYHMADLVSGLLKLAKTEGLDWSIIMRDARELLK